MTETTGIKRSIEVEYWVVDDEGRLVEPGALVNAGPGVEREFVEPVLEVKTTPCTSATALREELFERLRAVLDVAADRGKGLVPLATPVHAEGEIGELPSDRTRIQNRVVGEDFQYVRRCAGTHVHVEQQEGRAIDQLNTLVALDPALALVNSSPYFRGRRLAAGARSKLYRWMAYDSLPHQGRLWRYAEDREDWQRRLERRYEEFCRAAREAGVDRRTLHADFDPESTVWTPVQLRGAFGTVEWRSPDTALPSQVLRLAEDLVGAVDRLTTPGASVDSEGRLSGSAVDLPPFDTVIERVNAAIRDGLADPEVRSYLDRMGFDVDAYDPIGERIDGRAVVSPADARDLRLEYARKLESEVRKRSAVSAD
jgi:gamma-glutamyl:cysteine ligase YbdK (ATP-grasp superfamily)